MTMVQVGPVLEAMEDILAALLRSLDGRVYVAVGRGLWDFTSKDIYDYVDSLQEGKENKVGACACQSLCHLPDQPKPPPTATCIQYYACFAPQLLVQNLLNAQFRQLPKCYSFLHIHRQDQTIYRHVSSKLVVLECVSDCCRGVTGSMEG